MPARTPLRIAVTGLAATYPFGGVFWDYIQYALGFLNLGHDVLYIEDTGRWCYDPLAQSFVSGGENNAAALGRHLADLDPRLADRWFYRDAEEATYGRSWSDVVYRMDTTQEKVSPTKLRTPLQLRRGRLREDSRFLPLGTLSGRPPPHRT